MLTDEQAGQIVVNCVKAISKINEVHVAGTLGDAEIFDQNRVNNMVTLIVNSKHIGVLSQLHRISSSAFNKVSPDTIVDDVVNIVRDKAAEIHANLMEDFASMVASHMVSKLK